MTRKSVEIVSIFLCAIFCFFSYFEPPRPPPHSGMRKTMYPATDIPLCLWSEGMIASFDYMFFIFKNNSKAIVSYVLLICQTDGNRVLILRKSKSEFRYASFSAPSQILSLSNTF